MVKAGNQAREIQKENTKSIRLSFGLVLGISAAVGLHGPKLQIHGHGRNTASFCHSKGQIFAKQDQHVRFHLPSTSI